MKKATAVLFVSMAAFGCKNRQYNEPLQVVTSIPSWRSVPELAVWKTHDKPTWMFNYSDVEGPAARDPVKYLQDAQRQWTACQEKLRRGDPAAKENECSNGGVWRGMGQYFAEDPFSSGAYGNTLVAVRVKPNLEVPSLYTIPPGSAWGDEYPEEKREELWKTDVPGTRYQWGPGFFTGAALIVRDMDAMLVPDAAGKPEVHQFSAAKPQRGTGRRAGVGFSAAPSLACNPSAPLPEKLKLAAYQPIFMNYVASQLRATRDGINPRVTVVDPATGKLTLEGKVAAIISEINSKTPAVQAGLEKIRTLNLRGEMAEVLGINHLTLETFEVFLSYKVPDNEEIDDSYAAWFAAAGFLPEGRKFATARELAQALAEQWSALPNAEKRALEAFELTKCILDDLQQENFGLWTLRQ